MFCFPIVRGKHLFSVTKFSGETTPCFDTYNETDNPIGGFSKLA